MKPVHLMRPDEIAEIESENKSGCYTCIFREYIQKIKRMGCLAEQPNYPLREDCTWYKPKGQR